MDLLVPLLILVFTQETPDQTSHRHRCLADSKGAGSSQLPASSVPILTLNHPTRVLNTIGEVCGLMAYWLSVCNSI